MRDLPEKIDSKFRYVLLSATRAEQMMRGAQPRIEPGGRKMSSVAMDEIIENLVAWDYGPEATPDDEQLEADVLGETPDTVSSEDDAAVAS